MLELFLRGGRLRSATSDNACVTQPVAVGGQMLVTECATWRSDQRWSMVKQTGQIIVGSSTPGTLCLTARFPSQAQPSPGLPLTLGQCVTPTAKTQSWVYDTSFRLHLAAFPWLCAAFQGRNMFLQMCSSSVAQRWHNGVYFCADNIRVQMDNNLQPFVTIPKIGSIEACARKCFGATLGACLVFSLTSNQLCKLYSAGLSPTDTIYKDSLGNVQYTCSVQQVFLTVPTNLLWFNPTPTRRVAFWCVATPYFANGNLLVNNQPVASPNACAGYCMGQMANGLTHFTVYYVSPNVFQCWCYSQPFMFSEEEPVIGRPGPNQRSTPYTCAVLPTILIIPALYKLELPSASPTFEQIMWSNTTHQVVYLAGGVQNFSDAQTKCRARQGDLSSITTLDVWAAMVGTLFNMSSDLLQGAQVPAAYPPNVNWNSSWVGMVRSTATNKWKACTASRFFQWVDGSMSSNGFCPNWMVGEPTNLFGKANCVAMSLDKSNLQAAYRLRTMDCAARLPYMCTQRRCRAVRVQDWSRDGNVVVLAARWGTTPLADLEGQLGHSGIWCPHTSTLSQHRHLPRTGRGAFPPSRQPSAHGLLPQREATATYPLHQPHGKGPAGLLLQLPRRWQLQVAGGAGQHSVQLLCHMRQTPLSDVCAQVLPIRSRGGGERHGHAALPPPRCG